jgi:DNA-binding protein YbaB
LDDVERMVGDWERNAEQKAARFAQMQDQVEQISITESVADGAVSVTVGANGLPTDVTMTEGVRGMAPEEIASGVMAAMRRAQARYPARLAEILAETVGDDPAANHILATAERSFPTLPEDDEPVDANAMRFDDIEQDESRPASGRPPAPPPSYEDDDEPGDGSIFGR